MGSDYVDKNLTSADDFNRDFQEQMTEWCWGFGWGDDTIDEKTRSMMNLTMIAALEVEATLLHQAAVHNCAVAPVADAIRGEEVMACIMLAPETDATRATAEAIVGFTLGALVYFKAPGYVAFVEQLPMTTSQKIQRGEVKRLCAELLENGECFDLRSQKRRRKPETPSA